MRLELTRRGDYAVRTMVALADADGWRSANRIAAEMGIPARFLPRVLRELARAGLVEARPGRTGGYRLTRPPSETTLLEVIDAIEPRDAVPRCVLRGIPCSTDGTCPVHHVFAEAGEAHRARLAAATLASVTSRR